MMWGKGRKRAFSALLDVMEEPDDVECELFLPVEKKVGIPIMNVVK